MKKELLELQKRLIPDLDQELEDFICRFKENRIPSTYSAMEKHFQIAKRKPSSFTGHKRALAISMGGSNTKIMLASMKQGLMYVDYVRAMENPRDKVDYKDFFDDLLLKDQVVCDYLRNDPCPEIGISIPMVLKEDCPMHATKLPFLEGMIARSPDEIRENLSFSRNFKEYMASRPFSSNYRFFYQSDGIVAHHGAVSLSDVAIEDKTILCICGTGMANGDERHYLPMLLIKNLPDDEELYPAEETENHELQYAVAGKGIHSVMKNALKTIVKLGNSSLDGKHLETFFKDSRDSRKVFELYQHAEDPGYTSPYILPILEAAGAEGEEELLEITKMIVHRVCGTLSNCIFSTMLSMNAPQKGGVFRIFMEGSIARNPCVKRMVFEKLHERIEEKHPGLDGRVMETELVEDPDLKPLQKTGSCTEEEIRSVDTTLVGTVSMVMAECSTLEA